MKIVKVVFLDSNGKLPQGYKSYNFLIKDSLIPLPNNNYTLCEITNGYGYNYRGSKVVFIAYRDIEPQEEISNYKEIIKVVLKSDTKFIGDTGIKNIVSEEYELLTKGWKLIRSNFNDLFASENTAMNTVLSSDSISNIGTASVSNIPATNTYTTYFTYDEEIEKMKSQIDRLEDKNKKENTKMFENLTKNLKCGRAQDVRMSIYGPAFKGEDGNWYSVDNDNVLTDVSDLLLDMDSCCYMMPVAKSQVKQGDFILHNGHWVKITYLDEEYGLSALDIFKKEQIVPALTKSPFGFEFYTKLIPLLDFSKIQADANNPFGILPMILMTKNKNSKDMLPLLMMTGTQGEFNFDMSNPMMMYLLMKDGDIDNLLPFLMMSQMNKTNN